MVDVDVAVIVATAGVVGGVVDVEMGTVSVAVAAVAVGPLASAAIEAGVDVEG